MIKYFKISHLNEIRFFDLKSKNGLIISKHFIFFQLMWIFIYIFIFPSFSYTFSTYQRRNISIELRWGYHVLDTPKFEESEFGRRYGIIGGMKFNIEFFNQILQLGLGAGYLRENDLNCYFYSIPVEGSVNIRFKFSPDQLIIPYIGGGLDYSYSKQHVKNLDPNSQISKSSLHARRSGYHINCGFQLLLNCFSSEISKQFDRKFGVNATYITIEARYADLTNFGALESNETDLSGWFYYMGILFEF